MILLHLPPGLAASGQGSCQWCGVLQCCVMIAEVLQAVSTSPKPVSPFTPAHYITWAIISLATFGLSAGLPDQASVFGPLFLLASTVTGYLLGVALPTPFKAVCHPLVTCGLYGSVCCRLLAWVSGTGYHELLSAYMYKVCTFGLHTVVFFLLWCR